MYLLFFICPVQTLSIGLLLNPYLQFLWTLPPASILSVSISLASTHTHTLSFPQSSHFGYTTILAEALISVYIISAMPILSTCKPHGLYDSIAFLLHIVIFFSDTGIVSYSCLLNFYLPINTFFFKLLIRIVTFLLKQTIM